MTGRSKDALLRVGGLIAASLQALSALAGTVTLGLIPIVILGALDLLPPSFDLTNSQTIALSPAAVVAILVLLTLILIGLFKFFGRMRILIKSVGEGDSFAPGNARHLEVMGWLLLGIQLLAIPVAALRYYLATHVPGAMPGENAFHVTIYDFTGLLLAIVLFILARVFRQGAAMREDLTGTV